MKTTNEVLNEISVPAAGSGRKEPNIRPHPIISEEHLDSGQPAPFPTSKIPHGDQTRMKLGKRVGKI
jgi:hypothetical protein